MIESNKPYVKEYDENGNVTNEITKANPFLAKHPNRKQRKESMKKKRFMGNKKGISLTVLKTGKFRRHIQDEIDESGRPKRIEHYIPC